MNGINIQQIIECPSMPLDSTLMNESAFASNERKSK
jgi:hypothetical protein